LFQGCPLSVYLALSIAFISEHDTSLTMMGHSIRGCRYVWMTSLTSLLQRTLKHLSCKRKRTLNIQRNNHPSLTVKEEPKKNPLYLRVMVFWNMYKSDISWQIQVMRSNVNTITKTGTISREVIHFDKYTNLSNIMDHIALSHPFADNVLGAS